MSTQAKDTRTHILATGRRLAARNGYTGVGIGELLKEAGVPKGSFYHYFPSKEAYGCALLQNFVEDYDERLHGTLDDVVLSARDRFLAYFADWRRRQMSPRPEDRCLVVKLAAEIADLSPDMSAILRQAAANIVARLTATLQDGVAEGSIAPIDNPAAIAEAVYHQWLGASLVASLLHDDAPLEAAMRMTERLVPQA